MAALVLAACGGGAGTAVTDQGHALNPKSALIASTTDDKPTTTLVIYDQSNLCDTLSALNPCTANNSGPDGTGLVFEVENKGGTPNTIQAGQTIAIADKADGGWRASGAFGVVSNGQSIFDDQLTAGTITFTSFSPNGSASGSYAVTTQGGAALQGDFSADFCQGLFSLITAKHSCSGSSGVSGCDVSCTCNSEKVSESCTTNLDGSSSCTCTNASGGTKTCTNPAGATSCNPPGSAEADCCNLSF